MAKKRKNTPHHTAAEFGLDPLANDDDLFRWFLLAYMFGKPIQSAVAARTWRMFIDHQLDTPWAIASASNNKLVSLLHQGGYTRYQHVMARSLHLCMTQLIEKYDGSLSYVLSICETEDEFAKQLQKFHGIGPKTAEIFMRETEEIFARRIE